MEYGPGTALIVVDVQNDFADPEGSLYVAGGDEAIGFVNEQIEAAAAAGATIAYSQDWHPETTSHFEKDGGVWPVHCVAETWGAQLHPGLVVADGAVRIQKGTGAEDGYSAFSIRDLATGAETPTGLDAVLLDAGVERVVVLGLATDYCVRATVVDAVAAGFAATVLADGIRPVNLSPGDGARAVADMVAAGASIA